MQGKKVGIVISYGLSNVMDSGAKNALQSLFDISKFVGFEIIGIVYGHLENDLERNKTLFDTAKCLGDIINKELSA